MSEMSPTMAHYTFKQEGHGFSPVEPKWDVHNDSKGEEYRKLLEKKMAGGAAQGAFNAAKEKEWEIFTGPARQANPSGEFSKVQYEEAKQGILDHLKETKKNLDEQGKPLDVVFLDLHGSMVVEGLADAENELVEEIQKIVGEGCFIIGAYDQHATERLEFLKNNMKLFYQTNPHKDQGDVGKLCIELAEKHLQGKDLFQTGTKMGKVAIPNIGLETSRGTEIVDDENKPLGRLLHKKIFEGEVFEGGERKIISKSFLEMVRDDPDLITWGIAVDHPYIFNKETIKDVGPLITIIGTGKEAQAKAEMLKRRAKIHLSQ